MAPEEAEEQVALFKPADLRESSLKLRPGDKVEFSIAQQDSAAGDVASDVVLVSRATSRTADGKPLMGCVISVKEGFGFIRWVALRPCGGSIGAWIKKKLCILCMCIPKEQRDFFVEFKMDEGTIKMTVSSPLQAQFCVGALSVVLACCLDCTDGPALTKRGHSLYK